MASVVVYNLPDHQSGDTFPGIRFTVVVNGSPSNLTGASIAMAIRGRTNMVLSMGEGMAITNAAAGQFEVSKQTIALTPGKYQYTIKITYANGDIKSYIKGDWRIV